MAVRIGFHGFGRIGRNIFRVLHGRRDFDIRCIADVASPESLAYLLHFDSIYGKFPYEVRQGEGRLFVDGRAIPVVEGREPGFVSWREHDVDIVVEGTGRFRARPGLEKHLEAGARRVLLTSPPADDLNTVYCVGINDERIDRTHKIVSNASCTSNVLALVVKVLDEAFGVERASMTTVHAYTNRLRLADVPHHELRRSRAAAENIIPSPTYSVRVVESILPNLRGRINGMALNVPIPDGSVIDLTTLLRARVSPGEVNGVIRSVCAGHLRGILEYSEQPLVSSDVVGNPHTGVFDSLTTKVLGGNLVKTVTWYDTGWGYANRCVDLLERMARTL